MREKYYTIVCPDCEAELFDGNMLACKNWLKNNWLEKEADYDNIDEDEINVLCEDCARMLS